MVYTRPEYPRSETGPIAASRVHRVEDGNYDGARDYLAALQNGLIMSTPRLSAYGTLYDLHYKFPFWSSLSMRMGGKELSVSAFSWFIAFAFGNFPVSTCSAVMVKQLPFIPWAFISSTGPYP